jgi:hypothetical protein
MKVLECIIILLTIEYSKTKCVFKVPQVGYISSFSKLLDCSAEYKEIYSEFGNPE